MSVMISTNLPEAFQGLEERGGYVFHSLELEGAPYGAAAVAEHPTALELHLEIFRWTHHARRELARDLEWLKDRARVLGKERIVGLRESKGLAEDEHWARFTRIYGFGNHATVQTATLEVDRGEAEVISNRLEACGEGPDER